MTRIDFYHLQRKTLEEVLPLLLQKAYATGNRVKVKSCSDERIEYLNAFLWTYTDESFLPHGSRKDGFAEQQPIWLTADTENPNRATFLFLVDGAVESVEMLNNFTRVFNIFDGNSESALTQARQLWKEYKSAGFEVNYWQQDNSGKWEQKA